MYKVKITARAYKEFKSITKKRQLPIGEVIEDLKGNPHAGKPLTRELTGKFSYRVGVFRIIYKINEMEKTVYVLTIGHRSVVYK